MALMTSKTPARRFHFICAFGLLTVALAISSLPLLVPLDRTGDAMVLVLVAAALARSIWHFVKALRSSPRTYIVHIAAVVKRLPKSSQIRHFRRKLWIAAAAFTVMTTWLAIELYRLETGAINEALAWAPLAFIYSSFGYWPAVLSSALLGIACCAMFAKKIRTLSNEISRDSTNSRTNAASNADDR